MTCKYLNKDSYGDILICYHCFTYSKFPEQWQELTDKNPFKCSSCGSKYMYYNELFVKLSRG